MHMHMHMHITWKRLVFYSLGTANAKKTRPCFFWPGVLENSGNSCCFAQCRPMIPCPKKMKLWWLLENLRNPWKNQHFQLPRPTPRPQVSDGIQRGTLESSSIPLKTIGKPYVSCSPHPLEQPSGQGPCQGHLGKWSVFENLGNHWEMNISNQWRCW